MGKTRTAPMIMALALLLSGCGQGKRQDAGRMQEHYQTSPSIQATAEIEADYGERIYRYTAAIEGSEREGSLTVLSPDNIAGTGTAWKDGQTVLDYDGISLETGALSPDGLSPADGIPVLLSTLRSGTALEWGSVNWGEWKDCLYLLLENPSVPGGESTVALWGDRDTGQLCHAELYWQEKRVLSFTFSEYVIQ